MTGNHYAVCVGTSTIPPFGLMTYCTLRDHSVETSPCVTIPYVVPSVCELDYTGPPTELIWDVRVEVLDHAE